MAREDSRDGRGGLTGLEEDVSKCRGGQLEKLPEDNVRKNIPMPAMRCVSSA